jgi:hypothetical protein
MYFFATACVFLLVVLAVSVAYNFRHAKMIIEVEDALSEALDVCDDSYQRMSRIMELPVAMATPEVEQVINEIKRTRDAVLYISNVLAEPYGGVVEEGEDGNRSEKEI